MVAQPEVAVMPEPSELSDAARELDEHARDVISDLSDFDVRKRDESRTSRLRLAGYFWIVFALMVAIFVVVRANDSEPATTSSITTTSIAATMSGSEPGSLESDGTATATTQLGDINGPLPGTWIMYITGSDEEERHAFTVQFIGTETGTVEILEDSTEFDTGYELRGDIVSFGFTRIRTTEFGDWSEMSGFEGTRATGAEFVGQYVRENWSCHPDRDPPCEYETEPIRFPARLVPKS